MERSEMADKLERVPMNRDEFIDAFRKVREQSKGATLEEIRAWIAEGRK